MELKVLTAGAGKVLTNGSAFGKSITLGKNDSPDNWREITEEEAAALQAEELPEELDENV